MELDHAAYDRVVARSNSTGAAWKLCQFPLPRFASVFRKRHYSISRWTLLSAYDARRNRISHTGVKVSPSIFYLVNNVYTMLIKKSVRGKVK